MNTNPIIYRACTGPNEHCRDAARQGRKVHVIPPMRDVHTEPALVMSTYHYATAEEGEAAIRDAMASAPTVATDADLYRYRMAGVPHFLPVGWIDPSMRFAIVAAGCDAACDYCSAEPGSVEPNDADDCTCDPTTCESAEGVTSER